METTQVSPGLQKPSFAKIAATASKENAPLTSARRPAAPLGQEQAHPMTKQADTATTTNAHDTVANGSCSATEAGSKNVGLAPELGSPMKPLPHDPVANGLKDVQFGARTPSLVVNGSGSHPIDRFKSAIKDGSDESQRADSNSELGTKPASLDGKSITSGTTFALDEKESLRPDDSASVKAAAAEDDDSFSFRGPFLPNSRMGSDLAARAKGLQIGDHVATERRAPQVVSGSVSQGVVTPQSATSDPPQVPAANLTSDLSNYMNAVHGQSPDEKLLEAMSSQKDRLFLLRLEAELIKFVQNSKEPFMDFPPSNSFCRMLTHKLADYYHMTHQYEPRIGSVRIFRTPYARVPESLASIGVPEPVSETPPPVMLPRKIMRRGEDVESGTVSGAVYKVTSEDGSDGKEKSALANQKLSREQREEAYKQARERIFGNSEKTGESTPDNEAENGMSRASSVSAKDRASGAKRGKVNKQRRDDSDSLDSRHLYGPFGPQQSWVQQPQFPPHPGSQYPAPMPPTYVNQMQTAYTAPGQAYPPPAVHSGYPAYPNMAPYQAQPPAPQAQQPPPPPPPPPPMQPTQHRPQMLPSPNLSSYGAPVPVSVPTQPGWQQGFNGGPAPPMVPAPAPAPMPAAAPNPASYSPRGMSASSGVPYAYGQLPAHMNPNDPKSQHPIPGSYNRHAFNPKTQSFVPGGGMASMQQPQPSFSAPGSHHNSPQIGSPRLSYVGYQQPGPPGPYGGPAGYGMARQGSNNSAPLYHAPPPQHPQHPQHMMQSSPGVPYIPPQPPHQAVVQTPIQHHIPNKPVAPQGPAGQTFSHLPHYGNPATLPQKPKTGI
ncbi:hypothetical protein VDGE_01481 [Verticillium dahliae]|uniref:R3H domain-containing protein n=1 Tax=Verticillium dahliae TaxID=27337 RepID=A0A444RVA6_VERDA|nr:hypothetical protein VDGE_01481 [Verticillium dahliae]